MSVLRGDCVEVMAGMEPGSVDAVVPDPPYGLEFMGKDWDTLDTPEFRGRDGGNRAWPFGGSRKRVRYGSGLAQEWHAEWAAAALRVAAPGAWLLAFGGTRTVHRMTCALEDAGWLVRDLLMWGYASGFPKSRSCLKPAWEPIVLCRKPGPLRALGIDAARIGTEVETWPQSRGYSRHDPGSPVKATQPAGDAPLGRWPANLVLTDPVLDGGWEGVTGGGETGPMPAPYNRQAPADSGIYGNGLGTAAVGDTMPGYGDTGTYSRFFMVGDNSAPALASGGPERPSPGGTGASSSQVGVSGDSDPAGGAVLADPPAGSPRFLMVPKAPTRERTVDGQRSPHPTQKPEALIRHLVRLVAPEGGLVLDPFLGSGTLGVVCDGLGVRWLGIEREPEYADWAERRVAAARPQWEATG